MGQLTMSQKQVLMFATLRNFDERMETSVKMFYDKHLFIHIADFLVTLNPLQDACVKICVCDIVIVEPSGLKTKTNKGKVRNDPL